MSKGDLMRNFKIIENLGDQDEASYKHILFAVTALYHLNDWEKGADYSTPGRNSTKDKIRPYWDEIVKIFNSVGKEEFKKLLSETDYDCDYRLDVLENQ